MARKLVALLALMALVSLAPAGAALAETYYLPSQGSGMTDYVWQEMYGNGPGYAQPGGDNGQFKGGYPSLEGGGNWEIALLKNTLAAEDEDLNPGTWTFTINYNALVGAGIGGGASTVKFYVNYNGLKISSTDLVLTTHATYDVLRVGPLGADWICHDGEILYGYGHNDLDGASFTFTGLLMSSFYNSSGHSGHRIGEIGTDPVIIGLKLEYTPVPLPAGVWLLGTGLLGLACLGRRRRT